MPIAPQSLADFFPASVDRQVNRHLDLRRAESRRPGLMYRRSGPVGGQRQYVFSSIVAGDGRLAACCLFGSFNDDPNVFVAGDLLWYPVEGNPKVRSAPDAMVAFGRPNGIPWFVQVVGRRERRSPRSFSRFFHPATAPPK